MSAVFDPGAAALGAALLKAFLLGLVHGVTPDEHTWPIVFSYAIGGYSTWRGLRAGLIFSLAFTAQQAFASQLAYFGLAHWFSFEPLHDWINLIVGLVMIAAGLFVTGRGFLPHLHVPELKRAGAGPSGRPNRHAEPRELNPWMPAVHGFIAGWGLDAFSVIIYTTLAPAMPSAATGWMPGFVFGIGTLCVQGAAGAAFGSWAARRGLPGEAIRRIALTTAARTLTWGGCAFVIFGLLALVFPGLAEIGITTPLRVHNLHTLGIPFLLVLLTVVGVGVTSFVGATKTWRRRRLAENGAPATLNP
jgi:sulfite exporter TauE/SafE